MIRIKRAYEPPKAEDGARFLVDRMWPRGIQREGLVVRGWLSEVGPSEALEKWWAHDPAKWEEFQRRYAQELEEMDQPLEPLLHAAQEGTLTLIYAAADTKRNNAVVLKEHLEARLQG